MPLDTQTDTSVQSKPCPSLADKILIEETFYLLLTPILSEGTLLPVVIRHNPDTNRPTVVLTWGHQIGLNNDGRLELVRLASAIARQYRFDWRDHRYEMRFEGQTATAHEQIQARARLAELCAEQGVDWSRLAPRYDAALSMTA